MTSTSIATLDSNVESLEKRETSPELLSPGGSPDRGPLSYSLLEPWELVQLMEDEVESFILLDCQPTLAYNSRHIMGAFGINLNSMIAKRLTAGRVSLEDIIIPKASGKEKYLRAQQVIVYDESTSDIETSKHSTTLRTFFQALSTSTKSLSLLKGGFEAFQRMYPTHCDYVIRDSDICMVTEDVMAWQTAPPVRICSYIIVGNEKDASSKECFEKFGIKYVLNVTNKCPNYFEDDVKMNIKYFRIPAQDNGKMRLLDYFEVASQFIMEARSSGSSVLIHCVAGISRSVTITIAYLMKQFHMPLQKAYDFIKSKRPAISPNLNFMGQLLEYERMLDLGNNEHSPELKAMDPLATALGEILEIDTSCQPPDNPSKFINEPLSSMERSSSTNSSLSSSGGYKHSLSYGRQDSGGIFSGTGLSASYSTGQQPFVLKQPSRKKRTQSEADMKISKLFGSEVKDGYGKRKTEPALPRVTDAGN